MDRPLVNYWHVFTHPQRATPLLVPAPGTTPCEAKNEAFVRLEALKQADPLLPQDNGWTLADRYPA